MAVAAIPFNGQKGSITITQAADSPDGFRQVPAGKHLAELKELFLQWHAPGSRVFPLDDPVNPALAELLEITSQAPFLALPFYSSEK